MLVDSHCHLDHAKIGLTPEEAVRRARLAGVERIVTICTRLARFKASKAIADPFDDVFMGVGVHPHEAGEAGIDAPEPLLDTHELTLGEDTKLPSSPYVTLLGMLVGLGAWNTLPSVITGYLGNPSGKNGWIAQALAQKPRLHGERIGLWVGDQFSCLGACLGSPIGSPSWVPVSGPSLGSASPGPAPVSGLGPPGPAPSQFLIVWIHDIIGF